MKKLLEILREKWAEYLIEIIVIILGILGAFALNNWNENRNERIAERELIKNLNQEFETNLIQLDSALVRLDIAKATLSIILNSMGDTVTQNFRGELLDSILWRASAIPKWQRSNLNIREIENSGKLGELRSDDLKNLLYDWLGRMEFLLQVEENGDQSFSSYISYIKEHGSWREIDKHMFTDLGASVLMPSNDHLLMDYRFENIVDDKLVWTRHRIWAYQTIRAHLVKIIDATSDHTE